MASRMESTGIPGHIQISRETYTRVHDKFKFEERESVSVKGKGVVTTYILIEPENTENTEHINQSSFNYDE
jgi:adenylate cyclase